MWRAVQSVTPTQNLIIRVLASIAAKPFTDNFQKLTDHRLEMLIAQLLDLPRLEAKLSQQHTQMHLFAIDRTQQFIYTCKLYLEIHRNSLLISTTPETTYRTPQGNTFAPSRRKDRSPCRSPRTVPRWDVSSAFVCSRPTPTIRNEESSPDPTQNCL